MESAGFIVTDIEGNVIWGMGETEDAAIADSEKYIDPIDEWDDGKTFDDLFQAMPATSALIEKVDFYGGDVAWTTKDGIADVRS